MDIRDAINEGTFSLDQNTREGLENRQAEACPAGTCR